MTEEKNSPVSGFFVPVAIVVGGALIIWAITKMLGSTSGYKKLVEELHSKTFGNRWVAAYELSKYISTEQIPEEDVPWLLDQLKGVYLESQDSRTKNFIILATAALKNDLSVEVLNMGLSEEDEKVVFNSVVALGNLEKAALVNFEKIRELLKSEDAGLRQVSVFALAKHNKFKNKAELESILGDSNQLVRYSAITALISLGMSFPESEVRKVFELLPGSDGLDEAQLQAVKLNILNAIEKNEIAADSNVTDFIEDVINAEHGLIVKTKAEQVLIELKKQ